MYRVPLSAPEAPALADLLKDVPVFAGLPKEEMACIRHLRTAAAEFYAAGDPVVVASDLLVVCSGEYRATAPATLSRGDVLNGSMPVGPIADRLTTSIAGVLIRLDERALRELPVHCPAITRALARLVAENRLSPTSKELRRDPRQ